jgi:hypothetical protein
MSTQPSPPDPPTASANPIVLYRDLQDVYHRFYDSVYAITNPHIGAERRQLLAGSAQLAAEGLIEPLPSYESSGHTVQDAVRQLGLPDELAEQAGAFTAPLMEGHELYTHQFDSLGAAYAGEDVVVSGGTGSGKTEAFWLPILVNLVVESSTWKPAGGIAQRWWEASSRLIAARDRETGRMPGMRALVVYPMNALVEDQLVRLRRALDGEDQLAWLDTHRHGHRFTFGRYTGQTPNRNLRRLYARMHDRAEAARRHDDEQARRERREGLANGSLRRHRPYLPRPLGAEQLSRPEMTSRAPDVLITNFSMLNIMLMREQEEAIFEQTCDWLAADRDRHRFTLVIDEIHSYVGTSGTEVGLLLRKLLHRLDVHPGQLVVIGASASLGDDDASVRGYLEEFFGRPASGFRLFNGTQVLPDRSDPALPDATADALATLGRQIAARDPTADPANVAEQLTNHALADCLVNGCRDNDDRVLATPVSALANRLDPHTSDRAVDTLTGMLAAIAATRSMPVRAHYFFRVSGGWWACSDPACSQVAPEHRDDRRLVGRLYPEPRIRCECGARCLDLLCCQTCGEVLLGGYVADAPPALGGGYYMLPDLPNFEEVPDRTFADQIYSNYKLYWPANPGHDPLRASWQAQNHTFAWSPAVFTPGVGHVRAPNGEPRTGYWYTITSPPGRRAERDRIPAIATRCPNCDDRWERTGVRFGQSQALPVTSHRRMRTPIWAMRAAADRVSQILTEELLHRVYDNVADQRLIAFSDSRQDAAKLAGGLDASHYRDTVRQLVVEAVADAGKAARDLRGFEAWLEDPAAHPEHRELSRMLLRTSEIARLLREVHDDLATDTDAERAMRLRAQTLSGAAPLAQIVDLIFRRIAAVGRDPAGPAGRQLRSAWWDAYDWPEDADPVPRMGDPSVAAYLGGVRDRVQLQLAISLYSGAGRDVESLGIGLISPAADHPVPLPPGVTPVVGEQIVWGALRKLGTPTLLPRRPSGPRPARPDAARAAVLA